MAKQTQKSLQLAELIRRSEAARLQIGQAHLQLKKKLDIPLRIKDTLKSSPLKWLAGSLGLGFVGSFLFRLKRRKSKHRADSGTKNRGWFIGLLMMMFAVMRPTIKIYATKVLTDYLQNQLRARADRQFVNDGRNPY